MGGFNPRWGRKLAAIALGAATIVTLGVVTAPGADAYVYTKGSTATVYVTNITPMYVTPPSAFVDYRFKDTRNITAQAMIVYRNGGVAANIAQPVGVYHTLWRHAGCATCVWQQVDTMFEMVNIPVGYNSAWTSQQQFFRHNRGYYYYTETTLTQFNNGWQTQATIRPNTVNDFACTAACLRYNDYVYIS